MQKQRLVAASVYIAVLFVLSEYLNGSLWPPFGIQGLWFYSAAAALLLGEFILEPYFTRPADALASSITVLMAAVTTSSTGAAVSDHTYQTGRLLLVAYAALVIAGAIVAIALKDSSGVRARIAAVCTGTVGRVGRAKWIFSVLLVASGFAAFADSAAHVAVLLLAWFVIVGLQPVEACIGLLATRARIPRHEGGIVESMSDPGTAVIRFGRGSKPLLGETVEIPSAGVSGTVVDVTSILPEPRVRVALHKRVPLTTGLTVLPTGQCETSPVVGNVGAGTDLEGLVISSASEAARLGLAEGRLVETMVGEQPTLYQVIEARLADGVEAGLPRQSVVVGARKLGSWNAHVARFEPVPWIPDPGVPVRLLSGGGVSPSVADAVGFVPGTAYGIYIDPNVAVTHNTAILGILGIGKTCLAWELVKRMLIAGVKVVVLDITGRYCIEFSDLFSAEEEEKYAAWLERKIAGNERNHAVRNDEAGNVADFDQALETMLTSFMSNDGKPLLVMNPDRFRVTRMEGKPFKPEANLLAQLTMVDITRMVSEKLLKLQQDVPRVPGDESASLCLVLEEAHSLIPEWNSAVNDGERQAVNGTARAILQGRKYGFGCMIVTQRTANVTKSILNQCNTVFGMRVFDATGMGFLENYIGPAHARLLASLQERQAIVFGRASSCKTPVLVDLNDHGRFNREVWAPALASLAAPASSSSPKDAVSTPSPAAERPEDESESDIDFSGGL